MARVRRGRQLNLHLWQFYFNKASLCYQQKLYVELIEKLKEVLHKNIDIRLHIDNNQSLLENVLIKGIKIYAKRNYRN
ncbi:MAG: hypothetical protein E7178_02975 [Erysipelotrichaceae bacterium]|jgi:hypothetical protein|nr:hypothetical protein [Erysipelotrichaceae bacterium]